VRNLNPTAGYHHWPSPARLGATSRRWISHESLTAPLRLVRRWRQRARDRTALARLDSRMLRDIGLTPSDVMREINRPFWRE